MALLAQAAGTADTAEVVLFIVFAGIALGAGLAMVLMRNIVHAALMLVLNFLSIAALYLGLQSSFLSIIQVIVYAGAIMVLFLFVIMLLGVDRDTLVDTRARTRVGAILGMAGIAAILLFGIVGTYTTADSRCGAQAPADVVSTSTNQACRGLDDALEDSAAGGVGVVADRLFGRYTFAFELAAVLLTVATIGAMLLGRREETPQDDDPAWAPSIDLPEPDEDLEMAMAGVDSVSIVAGEPEAPPPLVTDDPEVLEAQAQREVPGTDQPGTDPPGVDEPGVGRSRPHEPGVDEPGEDA